jgi:hypothetical protein
VILHADPGFHQVADDIDQMLFGHKVGMSINAEHPTNRKPERSNGCKNQQPSGNTNDQGRQQAHLAVLLTESNPGTLSM